MNLLLEHEKSIKMSCCRAVFKDNMFQNVPNNSSSNAVAFKIDVISENGDLHDKILNFFNEFRASGDNIKIEYNKSKDDSGIFVNPDHLQNVISILETNKRIKYQYENLLKLAHELHLDVQKTPRYEIIPNSYLLEERKTQISIGIIKIFCDHASKCYELLKNSGLINKYMV